jgi:site-specific DNA recombinase
VLGLLDSGEAAGLVVFKLDRLTRNLSDWTALIERCFGEKGGRSLMSVSESIDTRTAAGRTVLNIMMTVAQWERETVVERTRGAMAFKRSLSERISRHIPYGFRLEPDGRTMTPDPSEAETVGAVRAWHAEGRAPRWLAAELGRRGVPTRTGAAWSNVTVGKLLKRPA